MTASHVNTILRQFLQSLINSGYKKHAICSLTLGVQSIPLFNRFLEGNELGIKPLERLFDGLGYKLVLLPVKRDEDTTETDKYVEQMYDSFLTDSRNEIIDHFNKVDAPKNVKQDFINKMITEMITNEIKI